MKIVRIVLLTLAVLIVAAGFLLFEADLPADSVDARYASDASRFLHLNQGGRIHYRDEGSRDGIPIVLVHGAMASLHTWEPWVRILGARYRVITLDLPGHGLTGPVPDTGVSDPFSEAIRAVTGELGVSRFVLGGNSMGGGATWRYALAYPEQVLAMILVDASPPPGWQRQMGESQRGAVGFSLLRQSWFRAMARYIDPGLLVEQGLRAAYNDSPVVDESLVNRYRDLILREGTRAAILERSRNLGAPTAEVDLSVLDEPTLILWGAQDALIPVSVATQFAAALPASQVIVYEDLGHVPMEEDPDRTAADVLRFLDALSPQPSTSSANVRS